LAAILCTSIMPNTDGVQMKLLSEWLGHSTISTTNMYTLISDEMRKQVPNTIDSIFAESI